MTRAKRQLDRVRSLLDDLDAVVWEADAEGRFTFVSRGAEPLLGFPRAAWLASGFLADRLHPDDRERTLASIAAAFADHRPFDIECRLLHRDGSVVWVRDLGRRVRDLGRRVRGARSRGVIVDVTRQKLEEERRSEIEIRHQRLIEHLPAIVYTQTVSDEGAGLTYISPQIRDILGIDPADWIGSSSGRLSRVHSEDRPRVDEAKARSDATGEPFAAEYRMHAADGRVVWFHDESALVRDEEGRPLLWQGVMLDVTDQRRAGELEDELVSERAQSDALREMDELKNTFLQAVSHDLRTPLAAILGLAVTLERPDLRLDPDDARDLAGRIAANARKLDRIVTDLLDLDRIGRGLLHPNLLETDVGALVERIIAESDVARTREVVVEIEHAVAEVDPPKVERIVENLLANSARHTPANACVWVGVREEPGGVTIVVEDDGPGIPAELRESVFEPFNRGRAPVDGSGAGIGLALVARFAQLHDGRAWVEERPGGGASFRVWLPARRASANDGADEPQP